MVTQIAATCPGIASLETSGIHAYTTISNIPIHVNRVTSNKSAISAITCYTRSAIHTIHNDMRKAN